MIINCQITGVDLTDADREAAEAYAQKEWDDYQEHLRIGGNQLHVRSFIKLGVERGIERERANDLVTAVALLLEKNTENPMGHLNSGLQNLRRSYVKYAATEDL
jgi:hypothetical protein